MRSSEEPSECEIDSLSVQHCSQLERQNNLSSICLFIFAFVSYVCVILFVLDSFSLIFCIAIIILECLIEESL